MSAHRRVVGLLAFLIVVGLIFLVSGGTRPAF
jgi:hypothetical protein